MLEITNLQSLFSGELSEILSGFKGDNDRQIIKTKTGKFALDITLKQQNQIIPVLSFMYSKLSVAGDQNK